VDTALIAATDGTLVVTGNVTPVTISLTPATTATAGHRYAIKDGDGTSATLPITVAANGTDTIDGGSSTIINLAFGSLDLVSNGVSAWRIL